MLNITAAAVAKLLRLHS